MAAPRILGGRYELGPVLGRGGMAVVHAGTDTTLGRPVAVKILADRYADDDRFVERFRREAQASARLNHPNIVSVYDTGDEDGIHYIVMELVDGETLADLLRREGPLSVERSARIAADVAKALAVAHTEGIIHRDVKPGNVMLTPAGEVKVMDFGIARAAEEDTLTQTGVVLGTAAYLSPEQSRGDAVDSRSDTYALGCVLTEMLTGEPPFTGETPVAIAYRHVNEMPDPPSSRNPGVPAEMDAVVMRALEKDPAGRFPDARSFGEAIAQASTAVSTEPIGPVGDTAVLPVTPDAEATAAMTRPPDGPSRRRWWPLAVAAVAVIVLAAIIGFGVLGDERDGRNGGPGGGGGGRRSTRSPPFRRRSPPWSRPWSSPRPRAWTSRSASRCWRRPTRPRRNTTRATWIRPWNTWSAGHRVVDEGLVGGLVSEQGAEDVHDAINVVSEAMQAAPPAQEEESPPPEEESPPPEEEEGEGEGGRRTLDRATARTRPATTSPTRIRTRTERLAWRHRERGTAATCARRSI